MKAFARSIGGHAQRIAASLLAALARLVCGGIVYFAGGVPDERQRVYFANHTSNLDFPLLWAYLPPHVRRRTRPVAAGDYWGKGIRALFARHIFRAVLVMRGKLAVNPSERDVNLGMQGVERMLDGLADGSSLIIFPEGTRGAGNRVAEFRSGLYHLARQKPGLELMPVYLHNLNRIMPKGEVLPVPMMARIVMGASLTLHDGEGKDAFLARTRGALQELADL